MADWTSDELNRIGNAEELDISPRRANGTLQSPRTIWVVRVGDNLYIRSVRGRTSDWFRGVQQRHEGRISAGGVQKDVSLEEIDDAAVNKQVDEAYLAKYSRYPQYVAPMVVPQSQAATLKLAPQEASK